VIDLGSVGIWTTTLDTVTTIEARRAAAMLDELGFGALWIPETVGRDPFVTAALLLGATSRIKVATGVANIYARDAQTMANTQRALEEAFPGRFLLGLGVSHRHLVQHLRHHDYSRPYSRMVRYLDEMDASVFRGVGPQARPPTVLAALGPRMLELAGARTAGAHPYFTPVRHTADAREVLGPAAILAPEQMVVLDTDRRRALETARRNMAVYLRAPNYANNLLRLGFDDDDLRDGGSERLVDELVACGTGENVKARVLEHFEAGATHVCIQVLEDDLDCLPERGWAELAGALGAFLAADDPA
jgi:probable F420-dependent oxidoreductase